ncbi:MAG: DNA polymerase/3'-5' exonuclease PolX [Chitinophagaceae bacterium]|nr:MAG: DNA polymerase/3'-5' exonuclease PolX [Chitinophagaceae bacterium]
MDNYAIADQFSLLSKLIDINGGNSFKSRNFSIAAYNIEKLSFQLKDVHKDQIPSRSGLGAGTVVKINELLATGSIQELSELLATTPVGVVEMLRIKGIGPKKIHIIWKEMDIESIGELEYACHENRLTRYKGFGDKTQSKILESIGFYNQSKGLYLFAQLYPIFPSVKNYLEQVFGKNNVLATGDFARQMPIVAALSFVINADSATIKTKMQTAHPPEIVSETEEAIVFKLTNGMPLELINNHKNIYLQQLKYSSSEDFFQHIQLKINTDSKFQSENEVFKSAQIPFIPPFLREKLEILEKKIDFQQIIQPTDIKGLIHNHSKWSDGMHSIEEMATHLKGNGFEYLVMSDHSKSAAYANGLSVERILQQHEEIDNLNKKLAPFKIFKSIESDILSDGSLDYNDEILEKFDLVIASIHSNLSMTEDKAMMRLMNAIENKYTTILGHPTGRLLLSRAGYPIDHKSIIDACKANHVAIEINANPHRLDMDWQWVEYAMEQGVILSINPDAHNIEGFNDTLYGVLAAQKACLTKDFNLSSFSLKDFENYLRKVKSSK